MCFSAGMSFWFLRFTGIEFDSSYVKFDGIDEYNRVSSNIDLILAGFNLYATSNLKFPLNFYVRVGSGIVQTTITYRLVKPGLINDKGSITSRDPYYKFGASLEYAFTRSFFLETGFDYLIIQYLQKSMNSIRYYGVIGTRF